MSGEISFTYALGLSNGNLDSLTIPTRTVSIDQATAAPSRIGGTQTFTDTEAAITLTGLTTNGVALFRNRHATKYVTIGVKPAATYYPLIRIEPGEAWAFRIEPAIAPYAKAETGATVKLECNILDD